MTLDQAKAIIATTDITDFDAFLSGTAQELPHTTAEYDEAEAVIRAHDAAAAAERARCQYCNGAGCTRCSGTGRAFGA